MRESDGACTLGRQLGGDKVHLWRTEEPSDKEIGWTVIEFGRRAYLFNKPGAQHDNAVCERHRLDLVVGDIDHGHAEVAMQLGDLDAHLGAQFSVEIGQGFVEQEKLWLAHDRAADGDALALAARQLARLALQQRANLQNARSFINAGLDVSFIHLGHAQAKSDIVEHAHVRIKRVGLENHRDLAVGRGDTCDHTAINGNIALGNLLKSGDHPHQSGFAAARRADENDKFAFFRLKTDAIDNRNIAVAFYDAVQFEKGHF